MKHLQKILPTFFFASILVAACETIVNIPADSPPLSTVTAIMPQASAYISPTTLPRETKNHWLTGPVIAIVPWVPGECFYCYFSVPPEAVLYADGRQIIEHEFRLYERDLSNQDVCSLLTEIDQSGFFEYTSDQYEQFYKSHRMKPAPEYYWINIDAWKSNSLSLFSFGFLFSQYKDTVEWPLALRIPYEKLTEFDASTMRPYVPDRVAIHIEKDPDLGFEVGTWAISSLPLTELIDRYNQTAMPESDISEGEMILYGDEAAAILKLFNERPWGAERIFVANNDQYLVAIRALLPYEESGGRDQSLPLIPDPNTEYLPIPMSCPMQ